VTALGDHAFDGFTNLTSFTIPKNITSIGEYAFANCTGLTSLTIPSWISTISVGTFQNCTGLKSFVIPNNVTSIGNFAFNGCTAMTGVVFEEGDEVLTLGYNNYQSRSTEPEGRGLFFDCPLVSTFIGRPLSYNTNERSGYSPFARIETLTKGHLGNPLKTIPDYLFYSVKNLKTIVYNENCKLESIGKYAFGDCKSLPTQKLHNTITVIDEGAFSNCVLFTDFDLPENLMTIGSHAFENCTGLTTLKIPATTKSIGNYAYNGCDGLTSVTVKWTKPVTIYSETFSNRTNAVLEVPHGSVADYKAANYWKEFKVIIEMGEDPVFVLKGDVNGDGVLSAQDASLILQKVAGKIK